MKTWLLPLALATCLAPAIALADAYQVTYGWTAPTWIPSDTPSYGAQYRLGGGIPVILPVTPVPGGGLTLNGVPGRKLEFCPQNINGVMVNPDCTLPEHWLTAGNLPFAPTNPPRPGGFSATIIRTGP